MAPDPVLHKEQMEAACIPLVDAVRGSFGRSIDDLTEMLGDAVVDALTKAYVAGFADGYTQAAEQADEPALSPSRHTPEGSG